MSSSDTPTPTVGSVLSAMPKSVSIASAIVVCIVAIAVVMNASIGKFILAGLAFNALFFGSLYGELSKAST